jgi:peptide/nickel transport system permease protein
MLKFIVRRLLVLPVIVLFMTSVLFLLMLQIPAEQRAELYLGSGNPHLTEAQRAKILEQTIERYGLDQPWLVQYGWWLRKLVTGDWGYSPTWRQGVLAGLLQRAPASLELTLFAMIPAALLAVGLGTLAAQRRGRIPDHMVRAAAFVAWAFPPFILALILMNLLYAWTGWLPPERMSQWASALVNSDKFHSYTGLLTVDALLNGNLRLLGDAVRHLVLPAFTLALAEWALLTRIMRSSLLDVMGQDYITTARAKGVHEGDIMARHARRNAILPLISAGGFLTAMLITGLVVIEAIFNFRGIGGSAVDAVLNLDVPVALGFAVFCCIVTVLANLVADILYAVVDPRVRIF